MRKSFQEILEELSKVENYCIVRDNIFKHFDGYNGLSEEKRNEEWKWFLSYILEVGWRRKYAYVLCLELFSSDNFSEELKDDFDGFYSMLIGDGIPTKDWIKFAGEPSDLSELSNYISSDKWFDD